MQSVEGVKQEIERDYADLLDAPYPHFSDAEMERRDRAADAIRSRHGLDALLIVEALRAGSATGWFTGWPVTAEAVTVILPDMPRRMYIQHYNHLPLARRIAYKTQVNWGGKSGVGEVVKQLKQAGCKTVGLIGRLPAAQHELLSESFKVVDANRAYTQARMVKSDEEIRWLSLAARLTDLAATALAEGARPGMNERQLSALVQPSYLGYGATNFIHYFLTTAMESPDTAVPRQFPSDRVLARGDVLSNELSVDYWGYTGQVLRTFFIGAEPNALYRRLHEVAGRVLDDILATMKPGVHARELIAASKPIEDAGFTIIDDLVHGYGGGYLPPILGSQSRPAGEPEPDVTLQAGMTLVVQPNVITPDGKAGVQTGQLVLVTEDGVRPLQQFPRGFYILPA